MTDQECEAWAQTTWGRAMLPCLWVQLFLVVFEHAHILGSLIRPEQRARDYVAATFHQDPPEFHAWLARRWLSWLRGFHERRAAGAEPTEEDVLTLRIAAARGLDLTQ